MEDTLLEELVVLTPPPPPNKKSLSRYSIFTHSEVIHSFRNESHSAN